MPKYRLDINVYEAAKQRIKWTFDSFDKIYLCFSAGKDSTVMLHLAMDEAKRRNKKIGVLVIDLEAQYKLTIDHLKNCIEEYRDYIDLYWIALPLKLRNAVSVYEPSWICWDKDRKNDWVRDLPEKSISDENYFSFFNKGMEFEEFMFEFGKWYSDNKKTACLVGIRTNESLNRFRAIYNLNKKTLDSNLFTTQISENLFNVYPIYDWETEDIWIYHCNNPEKKYNELYELMHKAGVPLRHQRICQPYGDEQKIGLWLFHIVEPETWSKVVNRVSGVNSGALYIKENNYNNIQKPKNTTWREISNLLLNSIPDKTKNHYNNIIDSYVKLWKDRGYPKGIPDEVPGCLEKTGKVPSWRLITKCILKNDYYMKGLGKSQPKTEMYGLVLKMRKNKNHESI